MNNQYSMQKQSQETSEICQSLAPIFRNELIGHSGTLQFLKTHLESTTGHHAFCLIGERGIGKATTIYHAIKKSLPFITSNSIPNENLISMLENRVNPDIFIVDSVDFLQDKFLDLDDKREKNEIPISTIRKVADFVFLQPSILKYKIIIIDAIDMLNTSSANALLKILEEPPKNTYFFLICHNERNVIKTILSRCLLIRCQKPKNEDFLKIANTIDINWEGEQDTIGKLSNYNIRTAIQILLSNGIDIYKCFLEDILSKTYTDSPDSFKAAEEGGVSGLMLLLYFTTRIIYNLTLFSSNLSTGNLLDFENNFIHSYSKKHFPTASDLNEKLSQAIEVIESADTLNIPVKHTAVAVLLILKAKNQMPLGIKII